MDFTALTNMNWTEGTLYRYNRGRQRKINPARQRQKEYFARARARAAEQRAAEESGPPPISYLQCSESPSSQRSHASNKSATSTGRRVQASGQHGAGMPKPRSKPPETPNDTPLPTISRFFQERSNRQNSACPRAEYDEEALERMRQKLLAKD